MRSSKFSNWRFISFVDLISRLVINESILNHTATLFHGGGADSTPCFTVASVLEARKCKRPFVTARLYQRLNFFCGRYLVACCGRAGDPWCPRFVFLINGRQWLRNKGKCSVTHAVAKACNTCSEEPVS